MWSESVTGPIVMGWPARFGCLGRALAAAVFPPRCCACGAWLDPPPCRDHGGFNDLLDGVLCRGCRQALHVIEGPVCTLCGQPFASPAGQDHLCGQCLRRVGLVYDMARTAGVYEPPLKILIHRLKYDGRLQVARPLGELLRAAFLRHWIGRPVDAIVPVPLHRRRLRERGFNQVQAMVRFWSRPGPDPDLAPVTVPVTTGILVRCRHTPAQASLDREERVRNLRAAFRVVRPEAVKRRAFLLLDDVMTTGATVTACAEALKRAGARRVDVLTLARAL